MANPSIHLLLILASSLLFLPAAAADDAVGRNQSLRDDRSDNLKSGSFILHFFSPNGTANRYLGVSYVLRSFSRVVWIANRDNPVTDRTGVLRISADGNLNLHQESTSELKWASTGSAANSSSAVSSLQAQLLRTGEFELKEPGSGASIWSSFDHPTDTMLPGMKIGEGQFLASWKTESDPSPGEFTYRLRCASGGSCEVRIVAANGSVVYRSGPWDATRDRFSGTPNLLEASDSMSFQLSNSSEGAFYSFLMKDGGAYSFSWFTLLPSGITERSAAAKANGSVVRLWTRPSGRCDRYNSCGDNSLCRNNSTCECLPGFKPSPALGRGCLRERELSCGSAVAFASVPAAVKLPDTAYAHVSPDVIAGECEAACRRECSCMAYANVHIAVKAAEGCIWWSGNLSDMRTYEDAGQMVAADRLFLKWPGKESKRKIVIATSIAVCGVAAIMVVICGTLLWRYYKARNLRAPSQPQSKAQMGPELVHPIGNIPSVQLRKEQFIFDYATMASATGNFNEKIGQGATGTVYKGIMSDGQTVAVKCLSDRIFDDAIDGFLNEATLIAQLQHRNLVRLLGCCTDDGKAMLVFEYMSNNSLDKFIFNENLRRMLQWKTRANIILGISRGLFYLHKDSGLRIIHRDLKPANILLDSEMNPKISDFGTARIFMTNQLEDKTTTVIGTIGYMAPEYAMHGSFSEKSDVYSFGVVMLEIISGRKVTKFTDANKFEQKPHDKNLLALAWMLGNNGNYLQLLDEMITDAHPIEVSRYIQIALLCVQENIDDRPSMSEVNSLLNNEDKILMKPNMPGIYHGLVRRNTLPQCNDSEIIGQMTITDIEGR